MTKLNGLGSMSYAQLVELRDRVDAALLTARAAEKQDLRAKMESLAAKSGFTLADVLETKSGAGSSRRKASKVAAKYRNPKDASQTWSGRGRKPNWLAAALKKGQKIDSFVV